MKIINKILDKNLKINDNTFIFDIETTGLNSKYCKIILIGILYNCQNKTIIKQFFAENEDEEKDILLAFINEVSCFKSHVTYNGCSFDIPFINYRLKKYNINFALNKEDDFDILKFIRPFKDKLGLENCSLDTAERYFGIHREDKIDGGESVTLYKTYVETKDNEIMEAIILHNYEDIYNLSKLVNIKVLIEDKLNLIDIDSTSLKIKLFPMKYKITTKKLLINYYIFNGSRDNITIYDDNYSISCKDDQIHLEMNINKGIDNENNEVLFYNMSNIIPLKYNDEILENNLYSLCNFIIKKELSSI
ncbi:MAG: ribonuclease H-like domain-containing protein [Terrisporobacter sp.]